MKRQFNFVIEYISLEKLSVSENMARYAGYSVNIE